MKLTYVDKNDFYEKMNYMSFALYSNLYLQRRHCDSGRQLVHYQHKHSKMGQLNDILTTTSTHVSNMPYATSSASIYTTYHKTFLNIQISYTPKLTTSQWYIPLRAAYESNISALHVQINCDRDARPTNHTFPSGDYMEIKTTFKCTRQRIITDKLERKSKHFRNFSIISTGEFYKDDTVTMIKYYYSDEQKNKSQLPPYRQRFILFMINKHHELMTRAGCTTQEAREAYDKHYEGAPAQQRQQQRDL
eukprot:170267-Amphidinium_carterae.5